MEFYTEAMDWTVPLNSRLRKGVVIPFGLWLPSHRLILFFTHPVFFSLSLSPLFALLLPEEMQPHPSNVRVDGHQACLSYQIKVHRVKVQSCRHSHKGRREETKTTRRNGACWANAPAPAPGTRVFAGVQLARELRLRAGKWPGDFFFFFKARFRNLSSCLNLKATLIRYSEMVFDG